MQVKLVSKTQPLVGGIEDPEQFVVYTARVSNPTNQANTETAPKLIKYLINHKHWSPFEMVDFCFEIQTSRAIAAQLLRHRSANFQEFSQRYSDAGGNAYIPDVRWQDTKNRQNSIEPDESETDKALNIGLGIEAAINFAIASYKDLLNEGVAKEVARMVLPMATSTTLYMKNNLRNWIHYVDVRTDPSTQKEHRVIALKIKKILAIECPNVALACGWRDDD